MFFLISKTLSFLIHPLTWVFSLLLISAFSKKEKAKKYLYIAIAVFYFFSNDFILTEVMRVWEEPRKSISEIEQKYDAVIILGGMITYDSTVERMQASRSIDRSLQGILLYKKGIAKKIFISGGSGSIHYKEMKEALILKDYLIGIGFPEEDILLESDSKNTHENALYTKQKLEEHGIADGNFLLVTSAMHMYRAKKCFQKQGLNVDTYSADVVAGPRKFVFDQMFIPNGNSINEWYNLLHELIGIAVYKAMGYI
jgi:uncharacterized SAM-binding protein YcdF (DUF218 family)